MKGIKNFIWESKFFVSDVAYEPVQGRPSPKTVGFFLSPKTVGLFLCATVDYIVLLRKGFQRWSVFGICRFCSMDGA